MSDDVDPIPGEGDPVATGPKGEGEWPDKDAPARGAAPGTDPARAEVIEAGRKENVAIDTEAKERIESFGDAAGVATMPPDERDELLGRDTADRDDTADRGDAGGSDEAGDDAGTDEAG